MRKQDGKKRELRSLGSVMDQVLGARGLGGKMKRLDALRRGWLEIAGPELGGHTRVRALRRQVLTIEVDSAPLCHELASFRKHEFLRAFHDKDLPSDIEDIHFRLGSLG